MIVHQDILDGVRPDLCASDFVATYSLSSFYDFAADVTASINPYCDFPISEKAGNNDPELGDEPFIGYRVFIPFDECKGDGFRCIRILLSNVLLLTTRSATRGRAAYRFQIFVAEPRRRQGICRGVIDREEKLLFEKWGAQEVKAFVEAPLFKKWTRSPFNYEFPKHKLMLLEGDYRRWANDNQTPITSLDSFPDEFWKIIEGRGTQTALLFKSLVRKTQ